MAFIPIPNGASLCFHFTTAGQNWQFCLTVTFDSGDPSYSDLGDLAGIAYDWWGDSFQDDLTADNTLNEIVATDQTAQGAPAYPFSVSEAGTRASYAMPLNSPMCVSLRTNLRGRSYRGRMYVSGFPTTVQLSATDFTTAEVANVAAEFALLKSALNTGGWQWVVASKQHNGAVTTPAVTNLVSSIIVDTHIDSQRRRLAGRGS